MTIPVIYHSNTQVDFHEGPFSKEAQKFFQDTMKVTDKYLPKRDNERQEFLERKVPKYKKHHYRPHCYHSTSSFMLISHTSTSRTISAPPSHGGRRHKNDNKAAEVASIVAGVGIFLTCMAFLGAKVKNLVMAQSRLSTASKMKTNLESDLKDVYNKHTVEVIKIADIRKSIHKTERNRAIWHTTLLVAGIASAGALIAGGVTGMIPLMAAGAAGTLLVAGAILFTWTFTDNTKLKEDAAKVYYKSMKYNIGAGIERKASTPQQKTPAANSSPIVFPAAPTHKPVVAASTAA